MAGPHILSPAFSAQRPGLSHNEGSGTGSHAAAPPLGPRPGFSAARKAPRPRPLPRPRARGPCAPSPGPAPLVLASPAPGLCVPSPLFRPRAPSPRVPSPGPTSLAPASLPQAPAPPDPEPPASTPLHDCAAGPGSAKGAGAPQRPTFPGASGPAELSPSPAQARDPDADPIPARRTWMRHARSPKRLRGDAAGTRGRPASGSRTAAAPPSARPRAAPTHPHPPLPTPAPGLSPSPPALPLPAPASGLPTPHSAVLPAPQHPSICPPTDLSPLHL